MHSIATTWRQKFWERASHENHSVLLKEAALKSDNKSWTTVLTSVAVEACHAMGWLSAAKGHKLNALPETRNEYLGIDVMAFSDSKVTWPFPIAAIELENSERQERIAYSLWKVLCIRAPLRIVFCYRPERRDAPPLIRHLKDHVLAAIGNKTSDALNDETVVAVGYRNNAETFPYGFFRWWMINENTRSLELFD